MDCAKCFGEKADVECALCKRAFHTECVPAESRRQAGETVECGECHGAIEPAIETSSLAPPSGVQNARGRGQDLVQEQPGLPEMVREQPELEDNQALNNRLTRLEATLDRLCGLFADCVVNSGGSPVMQSTLRTGGLTWDKDVGSIGDQRNGRATVSTGDET